MLNFNQTFDLTIDLSKLEILIEIMITYIYDVMISVNYVTILFKQIKLQAVNVYFL